MGCMATESLQLSMLRYISKRVFFLNQLLEQIADLKLHLEDLSLVCLVNLSQIFIFVYKMLDLFSGLKQRRLNYLTRIAYSGTMGVKRLDKLSS